jgi:thymidylate kinase
MRSRQANTPVIRDRFEEAGQAFFERVAEGFDAVQAGEPGRVKNVNGAPAVEIVSTAIWQLVEPILRTSGRL